MDNHAQIIRIVSYAQNAEDIVLLRALNKVETGFYIDVGAADPVCDSVTKIFYDKGWSGINIEPNEEYYEKLCAFRPRDINLSLAASSREDTKILEIFSGTGLSTLEINIASMHKNKDFFSYAKMVPTNTLDNILDNISIANNTIHYLKIDVEGHEAEVIKGMNFTKYRPLIIIYESTLPNTNIINDDYISDILSINSYEFCFFDGINKYFVAKEAEELKDKLYPANILDNYIRFDHKSVIDKTTDLENQIIRCNKLIGEKEDHLINAMQSYEEIKHALVNKDIELNKATLSYNSAKYQLDKLQYEYISLENITRTRMKEFNESCDAMHKQIMIKEEQLKNAEMSYQSLTTSYRKLEIMLEEAQKNYREIEIKLINKDLELEKASLAIKSFSEFITAKDGELINAGKSYQFLTEAMKEKENEITSLNKLIENLSNEISFLKNSHCLSPNRENSSDTQT